jgi:hypothetical protein
MVMQTKVMPIGIYWQVYRFELIKVARKVIDDHASKVIDTIVPLKEAGRTLQQIADTLNKSGVLTSRGDQWFPTTVSNILKRVAAV